MKKISQLILILLIFQFVILLGYYNFINFGFRFDISFLFDEEFVIMLAIFLVFFIFFSILSNFIAGFLNDRLNFLENSFLNSYNLFLEQLVFSKNLLKVLIFNLNSNLFLINKLNHNFFNFFVSIELQKNLLQLFYFQFFYLYLLLNMKKLI